MTREKTSLVRLYLALFSLFFISYAWFIANPGGHNSVCRLALSATMVQHGAVEIDAYEGLTTDKAVRNGRFYCDKAPGMSLLAAPVAFAFTRVFPIDPANGYNGAWIALLFFSSLSTSALFAAAAATAIFAFVWDRTRNITAGFVAAGAFGLATPVWGWAASFFSHAAAAGLLTLGYIGMEQALRRLREGQAFWAWALASGVALGLATGVEYTCFIAAVLMGLVALFSGAVRERPAGALALFAIMAGGAFAALVPVLIYHDAAFGSPFTTGYRFAAVFTETRAGLFGLNWPDPGVLGELLAGLRRGLIWYAPIVLAMAWAVFRGVRRPTVRSAAITAGLVLAWHLFMTAGFAYWLGGWSTGPRYLTPAFGLLAIALGLMWPFFSARERIATLVLLGVSAFVNFSTVAVDMTANEGDPNPLVNLILPAFFAGRFDQSVLGLITHTPTPLWVVPLVAAWAGLGWFLWREAQPWRAGEQARG